MRVLYAAMYNDPTDPMAASGTDYNFYTQIRKYAEEVRIAGPFRVDGWLPERVFKRLYTRLTGKRYMKWNLRAIYMATKGVNSLEREWKPDVVFSMFPSNLAFYSGQAPAVFATDTAFQTWQAHGANFGWMAFMFQVWLEKRAVLRSTRVIASSYQLKEDLVRYHKVDPSKIVVIPLAAAIPPEVIQHIEDFRAEKRLEYPLRLLLVGREFHRKGIDIAIEVVNLLNHEGIPAELTICGLNGPEIPYVRFVGLFNKKDPTQLAKYVELYRRAHLLIHPARFEAFGIVIAEAAALGTPTITNDVGGVATAVKHGVSGIVLPKHSPPEAYVQAIRDLISEPERYYALCEGARRRYEEELNWEVAGKQVYRVLQEAIAEAKR